MKPLVVLLIAFVTALLIAKLISGDFEFAFAGRIAMSVMLVFIAIAHFTFTKGMEMMLPDFVPLKKALVYFTGVVEIAAAAGLMIPELQTLTAWWLILFFVLLLPANIYAAIKRIDYQKGTKEGPGTKYLWFRVPLQFFFIAWVYFSALCN